MIQRTKLSIIVVTSALLLLFSKTASALDISAPTLSWWERYTIQDKLEILIQLLVIVVLGLVSAALIKHLLKKKK